MRVWKVDEGGGPAGALEEAAEWLAGGRLLAIPTETFYGLAADLRRPEALERVHVLKGRDPDKPLLLLVGDAASVNALSPAPGPRFAALAAAFWPGPLTLVVRAREDLPAPVVSPTGGVAVRQSSHPVVAALLSRLGAPVSGTSANLSGQAPVAVPGELQLPGLGGVLDAGPTRGGAPSTLVDVSGSRPRLLREGAVPAAEITGLLGERLL